MCGGRARIPDVDDVPPDVARLQDPPDAKIRPTRRPLSLAGDGGVRGQSFDSG